MGSGFVISVQVQIEVFKGCPPLVLLFVLNPTIMSIKCLPKIATSKTAPSLSARITLGDLEPVEIAPIVSNLVVIPKLIPKNC